MCFNRRWTVNFKVFRAGALTWYSAEPTRLKPINRSRPSNSWIRPLNDLNFFIWRSYVLFRHFCRWLTWLTREQSFGRLNRPRCLSINRQLKWLSNRLISLINPFLHNVERKRRSLFLKWLRAYGAIEVRPHDLCGWFTFGSVGCPLVICIVSPDNWAVHDGPGFGFDKREMRDHGLHIANFLHLLIYPDD
jgi:hypothetical protein